MGIDRDQSAPLIPLSTLYRPAQFSWATLSPDGRHVAYVQTVDDADTIRLRRLATGEDRLLARPAAPVRLVFWWAYNSQQLIYRQDENGDECYHYLVLDLATGESRPLTPIRTADGRQVHTWGAGFHLNYSLTPSRPDEVLLLTDERAAGQLDLYLVNTRTGACDLVQEAVPGVLHWLADHELAVRGYLLAGEEGSVKLFIRDGAGGPYREIAHFAYGEIEPYRQIDFTADNERLLLGCSAGRDTAALIELDLRTGARREVAAFPDTDLAGWISHPTRHTVDEVYSYGAKRVRLTLSEDYAAHCAAISTELPGEWGCTRSLDDQIWLVGSYSDREPGVCFTYDAAQQSLTQLALSNPALAGQPFAEVQPVCIAARDGLNLPCYLTLPLNYAAPGPLVLLVHGGPHWRDFWSFDPLAQWLANRGYACLQVNFRGSTGYGRRFRQAGDREWGRAMLTDLLDAAQWAVEQGLADRQRLGIMGESFGGYQVLAGLVFAAQVFACGVAISPVADLLTHVAHWQRYRPAYCAVTAREVGRMPVCADGPRAGELKDRADWSVCDRREYMRLKSVSPLHHVAWLRAPLLLAHGAGDTRCSAADSRRFAADARRAGAEVEYIEYAGEGHWLAQPEVYIDLLRRAERLFARTLGGRCED